MKISTIALIIAVINFVCIAIFGGSQYFIATNIFCATALICASIEKSKK